MKRNQSRKAISRGQTLAPSGKPVGTPFEGEPFLSSPWMTLAVGSLVLLGLYLMSRYNYLLFHSLVEVLCIVVFFGIYVITWNSRRFLQNNYILFIGIAYLFVAGIHILHTLAYKGMGIFADTSGNLATQLWITGRYVEGLALLTAPFWLGRRLHIGLVFSGFAAISLLLMAAIFYWEVFPVCFAEGTGLTPFKRGSEYAACLTLVLAAFLLHRRRGAFEDRVFRFLMASIVTNIMAELVFTLYASVYGFANFLGHGLKLLSCFLIYKAVIETGLISPYSLLFRELKLSQEGLKQKARDLSERVKELDCLYGISHIRDKVGITLDDIFQDVVASIPPSLQYPEVTCARIRVEGKEYATKNCRETSWRQEAGINVHGAPVGRIEVFHLVEPETPDDGPSPAEAQRLINAIGERLGKIIEHERAQAALNWELRVGAALSELYGPMTSPAATMEDISSGVLSQALSLTESPHGYVSTIDPASRDTIRHTFTEMIKGGCRIAGEAGRMVVPVGQDGLYKALWGHSLNTRKGFFTNSPQSHDASRGVPEGHLPIRRFLSVPVMLGEERVGQIALANKEGNYTEKDLAAITRLGEYYALAIQRKRAQDSLQKAHDALEVRVEERTAELRRLSSELLSIQEEERKRIALEVHDGIGQSLSAVKYRVEAALAELGEACSAKAFGSLKPIIPMVQEAVEETRRIQRNLRPPTLDDLGLLATLSWFCREFETTYEGVRVERKIELEEDAVPDMLKIVIYRVIQEAMNNIAKHSGASAVTLSLASIDGRIEMTVTDNGVGFDLERVPSPEMSERGMGLASMRERAELSGGLLSIKSEKGQGTVIHAAWPVDSVREAFRTK